MGKIYILYEERESSEYCNIKGVWNTKQNAIAHMQKLIKTNPLYSKHSTIDTKNGYAESDPMYNEEMYSNYRIQEFKVSL